MQKDVGMFPALRRKFTSSSPHKSDRSFPDPDPRVVGSQQTRSIEIGEGYCEQAWSDRKGLEAALGHIIVH